VRKIQEQCCQGLSASWASQRRTVEAETNVAMPPVVIRQDAILAAAVRAFAVSRLHHLAVVDNGGLCTGVLAATIGQAARPATW
jgi:CBS domain-containing protein